MSSDAGCQGCADDLTASRDEVEQLREEIAELERDYQVLAREFETMELRAEGELLSAALRDHLVLIHACLFEDRTHADDEMDRFAEVLERAAGARGVTRVEDFDSVVQPHQVAAMAHVFLRHEDLQVGLPRIFRRSFKDDATGEYVRVAAMYQRGDAPEDFEWVPQESDVVQEVILERRRLREEGRRQALAVLGITP